jgi:hypothetical protein
MNNHDRFRQHIGEELYQKLALAAAHGGTHTMQDIAEALATGRAQLHAFHGAAFVTEVLIHPNGTRTLNIWLAGGNLDDVRAMVETGAEFGRAMKCDRMTIVGRGGWERAMKEAGFERTAVVLTKHLENNNKEDAA